MPFDVNRYIKSVIEEGGWELRFSPQKQPFALLPQGFGSNESGIRLFFSPIQGQVKVTGVIEQSDRLRIKRPYVFISTTMKPMDAAEKIKRQLIPMYRSAWHEAQPKIQDYLERQAEREQATEELRRTLNLQQRLDIERGVEVLSGRNVDVILNNDMTVSVKLQVPHDLAIELLEVIKHYWEKN